MVSRTRLLLTVAAALLVTLSSVLVYGAPTGQDGPALKHLPRFHPDAVPLAPTALTAYAFNTTTIAINWTNPKGTVTAEEVSYGAKNCTGTLTHLVPHFSTATTVTGLTPGTEYGFEVTANNSSGQSPATHCVNSYTLSSASCETTSSTTGCTTASVTIPHGGSLLVFIAGLAAAWNQPTVSDGTLLNNRTACNTIAGTGDPHIAVGMGFGFPLTSSVTVTFKSRTSGDYGSIFVLSLPPNYQAAFSNVEGCLGDKVTNTALKANLTTVQEPLDYVVGVFGVDLNGRTLSNWTHAGGVLAGTTQSSGTAFASATVYRLANKTVSTSVNATAPTTGSGVCLNGIVGFDIPFFMAADLFPRNSTGGNGITTLEGGQRSELTFDAVGGQAPYTWTLTKNGSSSNLSGATWVPYNGFYNYTAASAVYYNETFYFNVTDALGDHAKVSATIIVVPQLAAAFNVSLAKTQYGEPSVISIVFTGGTTPITWSVHQNGSSSNITGFTHVGNTKFGRPEYNYSFNTTHNAYANYTFYLNGTSHLGTTIAKTNVVTLVKGLSTTLSAAAATVDEGVNDVVSYSLSFGVSPVTWTLTYSGGPSNVSGASGGHYTFHNNTAKLFTIYFNATDHVGSSVKQTVTITVVLAVISSLTGTPTPTEVGHGETITVSFSHGVLPISYTLAYKPGHPTNYTGPLNPFPTPIAQVYTFYLNGTDADNQHSNVTFSFTVDAALVASLSANLSATDVRFSVTFSYSFAGGVTPITWSIHINGSSSNITGATGGAWVWIPLFTGTYKFFLNSTDAIGFTSKVNTTVTVHADLGAALTTSLATTEVGIAADVNYSFSGGTAAITWTLKVNGSASNLSGASGGTYVFHPSAAGNYTFTLAAKDAVGSTATATVSVAVGRHLAAMLVANPSSVPAGLNTSIGIFFTGGISPISWSLHENGSSSNLSGVVSGTYVFIPSVPANFVFYLNATDQVGATGSARASVNATVAAPAAVDASANATSLTVVWSVSAGHVLNYTLEYGTAPNNLSHHVSVGVVTSYTVANVTTGVTWYVAIIAWEPLGHSALSGIATARTIMPGSNATNLGPIQTEFLATMFLSFFGLFVTLASTVVVYVIIRRRYG